MANALYAKGKQKMLAGQIDFSSHPLKVALVSNAYPQALASDEFLASVSAYVLNTAKPIVNPTIALGVFDANDVTFAAVTAGAVAEGVVIYKDTGSAATSPLIAYIDTITGFPVTTNGGDITIQWDAGPLKIFSL